MGGGHLTPKKIETHHKEGGGGGGEGEGRGRRGSFRGGKLEQFNCTLKPNYMYLELHNYKIMKLIFFSKNWFYRK